MRVWKLAPLCLALMACLSNGPASAMGARALSMGGAFTGLADDASAAYYNPAGLGTLKSSEYCVMHTAGDNDDSAEDVFAVVTIKPPKGPMTYAISGWGRSWHGNDWYSDGNPADNDIWVSASYKLKPRTYVGANVSMHDDADHRLHSQLGIDLGLLHVFSDKWSAGMLLQNINEPKIRDRDSYYSDSGNFAHWICAGVAYRPDKSTVLTMDIQNLDHHLGNDMLALGGEHVLRNGTALRMGYWYYPDRDNEQWSFGAGVPLRRCRLDVALQTNRYDSTFVLGMAGKL